MISRIKQRIDWDEYFLTISFIVAIRSTCTKACHGAIIVKDNLIISTGYNGAPKKSKHCLEVGCKMIDGHCLRARHAEVNAIVNGLSNRVNLIGSTIYITGTPCIECTKSIIREGISRVVVYKDYGKENINIEKILLEAGVSFDMIDISNIISSINKYKIGERLVE